MKYKLELTVFLCGAVVMALEMAGSRVFAPYLGSSIYVWTSLIGVILGCLSIGYALGGSLADKGANNKTLSALIFFSGMTVAVIPLIEFPVLMAIIRFVEDTRIACVIATIILFAPASVLLGTISPYAIRLKIDDVESSGKTVGTLYAISTCGSIMGTFVAGFFLISYLGTINTILFLAGVLLLTSLLPGIEHFSNKRKTSVLFYVFGCAIVMSFQMNSSGELPVDIDTNYMRLIIHETTDEESGRTIRMMQTDPVLVQSVSYTDDYTDAFVKHLRYFDLYQLYNPDAKSILLIGGAAYNYPSHLLSKNKEIEMDVVEIDPGMTRVAKEYFGLKDYPNMNIYHMDARRYLYNSEKKYDVIILDAYGASGGAPFQLCTVEAFELVKSRLNEGGVVIANVLGAVDGPGGALLQSFVKTMKEVYESVEVFSVFPEKGPDEYANFVAVMRSDTTAVDLVNVSDYFKKVTSSQLKNLSLAAGMIFTDNHAPIDTLTYPAVELFRKQNRERQRQEKKKAQKEA